MLGRNMRENTTLGSVVLGFSHQVKNDGLCALEAHPMTGAIPSARISELKGGIPTRFSACNCTCRKSIIRVNCASLLWAVCVLLQSPPFGNTLPLFSLLFAHMLKDIQEL